MPIAGLSLERPINLSQLLETGLRTKLHEPALVSFDSIWTWGELDQTSCRLGKHYLDLGLKPGDRVASLLPNCGELIVHYLACIRAGLVATPLNYRYQAPEIDHALEVSGAAVLLAHTERDEDLAKSKLAGQLRCGRISFGTATARAAGIRTPSLEDFLATDPAALDLPAPQPAAQVFIYFTSSAGIGAEALHLLRRRLVGVVPGIGDRLAQLGQAVPGDPKISPVQGGGEDAPAAFVLQRS